MAGPLDGRDGRVLATRVDQTFGVCAAQPLDFPRLTNPELCALL